MPDSKTSSLSFEKGVRIVLYILLISLATYAVMAVITHFSLHNLQDGYTFSQSLLAIFDTETAMYKFFRAFMFLETGFVLLAILIKLIREKIF